MINSWLPLRVVELAVTYLMHSTVFLGATGIGLTTAVWLGRRKSPANTRRISPFVEEHLWKLAAVMPLLSIPLSLYAGFSYEISNGLFTEHHPATSSMTLVEGFGDSFANAQAVPSTDAISTDPLPIDLQTQPASFSPADGDVPSATDPATTASQPPEDSSTAPFNTQITAAENGKTPSDVDDSLEIAPAFLWQRRLGLIFLGALALSVIRLVVRAFLVGRMLKQCCLPSADLQGLANRLTRHGRNIRLLIAPASTVLEPFACGIWRWTIVLPQGIEQHLTPAEMKALLAHEVAHLIRRDPLWLFVGELLCTALAVQPLNFIARRHWLHAAELLCDDWAVQQNVSTMSLASCLTKIAERRLGQCHKSWGLAAVGRSGQLTHRIEWLLRNSRVPESESRQLRLRMTAAIFVLAMSLGAFGPRFVLPLPADAASAVEASPERFAIETEISAALDELRHAELLLERDQDPQVAIITSRLRTRIESIRRRLRS